MKKVLCLFVIFWASSFLSGAVIISCQDLGNHIVQLSYDASGESSPVAFFPLIISVSDGVITNIELSDLFPHGNEFESYGQEPGDPSAGWLDSNSIVVELAMINSPPATGVLFNFTVSENCYASIAEDVVYRGGVRLQNMTHPTVLCYGCDVIPEPATILLAGLGAVLLRRKRI